MTNITFAQLLAFLPRGDSLIPKTLPLGLSYTTSSNPSFVEPTLRVEQPMESGTTSVVLLSAPGAVGKSTLAAELAARTGSTLWDLSELQVGSRTFSGTLMEAWSFEATGVLKRRKLGEFLFVMDALDETQVRAGSQNFDAFLADLAEAQKLPMPNPTLVLLARTETADWIHLVLEEADVPLARFQIDFFDRQQATLFLEKRLDERRSRDGKQAAHRIQSGPYAKARTVLLEQIYELFDVSAEDAWGYSRVKNFLGYAPVLEALTDYLDVGNFMAFAQEIRDESTSTRDPWEFLSEIIQRLLVRERGKVQQALQAKLANAALKAKWAKWHELYSAEEQCNRVLAHTLKPEDRHAKRLPAPLDNEYEEALKTILPQHPFLSGRKFANVVFKEYLYAFCAITGSDSLTKEMRKAMRDLKTPFLPSQLFSRFVTNLAGDKDVILDGQDFGVFYESLLSRTEEVELTLLQDGDVMLASISLGSGDHDVVLRVLDTGLGVLFWRRLAAAAVDVAAAVRLGLPHVRFRLGPGVDLRCPTLETNCESIDIDLLENVRIKSDSYTATVQPLKLALRNEQVGCLAVAWPNVGFPWAPYYSADAEDPLALSDSVRGDSLRKFLLMFRRQRTRRASTLLGSRWSDDQRRDRDKLIDMALEHGVLRMVEGFDTYEFCSDFDSLRGLVDPPARLSAQAITFLSSYLGTDVAERVLAGVRTDEEQD